MLHREGFSFGPEEFQARRCLAQSAMLPARFWSYSLSWRRCCARVNGPGDSKHFMHSAVQRSLRGLRLQAESDFCLVKYGGNGNVHALNAEPSLKRLSSTTPLIELDSRWQGGAFHHHATRALHSLHRIRWEDGRVARAFGAPVRPSLGPDSQLFENLALAVWPKHDLWSVRTHLSDGTGKQSKFQHMALVVASK